MSVRTNQLCSLLFAVAFIYCVGAAPPKFSATLKVSKRHPAAIDIAQVLRTIPQLSSIFDAATLQARLTTPSASFSGTLVNSSGVFSLVDENNYFTYVSDAKGTKDRLYFDATYTAPNETLVSVTGVCLTLTPVNHRPVANGGVMLVFGSEPTMLNVFVEDEDTKLNPNLPLAEEIVNIEIVKQPEYGTLEVVSPLTLTYRPGNLPAETMTSFKYRVTDASGDKSNIAEVTLQSIRPGPPIAFPVTLHVTPANDVAADELTRVYYINLEASTAHTTAADLVFKITSLSPRWVGRLVVVSPKKLVEATNKFPVTVSETLNSKTRVVLVYEAPATIGATQPDLSFTYTVTDVVGKNTYESEAATVKIEFVRSGKDQRRPVCNAMTYPFVVHGRPTRVRMPYLISSLTNVNNTNIYLRHLMLLETPENPAGDLFYKTSDEAAVRWTRLKVGDYFRDEDDSLVYVVRQDMMQYQGAQTYKFRAENNYGDVCLPRGSVTFSHVPRVATNANKDIIMSRWFYLGGYNLMRLPDIPGATSVVLVKRETISGHLYSVNSALPIVKEAFGRRFYEKTFCEEAECSKYVRGELTELGGSNSNVPPFVRDDRTTEYRMLYRAEAEVMLNATFFPKQRIENFTFVVTMAGVAKPRYLKLRVLQLPQRTKTIDVQYQTEDSDTNLREDCLIAVTTTTLPPTTRRVCVLERDATRRHGRAPDFALFQYRRNGMELMKSEPLTPSTLNGTMPLCKWVLYENKLILKPTSQARRKRYSFRVRFYDLDTATGQWRATEVRRVVVRRTQTPPRIKHVAPVTAHVGEYVSIPLEAEDDHGDRVNFLLTKAPKYGYLEQEVVGLMGKSVTHRVVHRGGRIRVPKWKERRQSATVRYQSTYHLSRQYPIQDTFVVVADNGGGTYSEPITVLVTVQETGPHTHSSRRGTNTALLLTVMTVITVVLAAVVLYVYRRRLRRYVPLAPDVEMTSVENH